jgi:hypothetical protein
MMTFFAPMSDLHGFLDQVLAGLHEHLNGDVVGNVVLLDEQAVEGEFRVRGGREAHLDFLETTQSRAPETARAFARHSSARRAPGCQSRRIHAAPDGRALERADQAIDDSAIPPAGTADTFELGFFNMIFVFVTGRPFSNQRRLGSGQQKTPPPFTAVRFLKSRV